MLRVLLSVLVRVDLHSHSTASDGTDSPQQLVAAAARAGLDVLALTDHDTAAGWGAAAEALPPGLTLVGGAELSCAHEGVSLHLLAYLFEPGHVALAEELSRSRDDRIPRAREMVRLLAADGYPVTWEDVLAQVGREGATVGRPHIADALVAAGAVRDRDAAFAGVLHGRSRYYVRHYAVDPVTAVRLVAEAGGVTVFAHPRASRRGRIVPDSLIGAMTEAGLSGVEVDHRDHDDTARRHLRGLAAELGLLATGASDYHGTGGKANALGENVTAPEVYEALISGATGELVTG